MKLLTEMEGGCVHALGFCVDSANVMPREVENLEHDAAVAPAQMLASDGFRSGQPDIDDDWLDALTKRADAFMLTGEAPPTTYRAAWNSCSVATG